MKHLPSTKILVFSLSAFIFGLGLLGHWGFLSGRWFHYHDSLVNLGTSHLFFDSLFLGHSPLWSPEQNGGQPLWPTVEAYQSFDPIALIVWSFSYVLKFNSVIAQQWTCFLWLFLFALGGSRCARFLRGDKFSELLAFSILFLGPLSAELVAQSCGFLLPYRYLPWVIVAFLELTQKVSLRRTTFLGSVLGISAGGYQSISALVFLGFFGFFYLTLNQISFKKIPNRLPMGFTKHLLLSLSIAGLWFLPTLIACVEMLHLASMPRLYYSDVYFSFHLKELFSGLIDFSLATSLWHGHSYIGLLPLALVLVGLHSLLRNLFSRLERTKSSTLELTWFLSTIAAILLSTELVEARVQNHKTFLGLRNWGYYLTPLALCLSQLSVLGFACLQKFNKAEQLFFSGVCFALAAAVGLAAEFWVTDPLFRIYLLGSLIPIFLAALLVLFANLSNTSTSYSFLAVALVTITSLDIARISRRNFSLIDGKNVAPALIPRFGLQQSSFQEKRIWKYNYIEDLPFHYEGAAIHKKWVAISDPLLPYKRYPGLTGITHAFRLPRYENLLQSGLSEGILKNILGVSAPIIKIVHNAIPVKDYGEALSQLKHLANPELLNKTVIIEHPNPEELQKLSGQDESSGVLEKWQVRSFHPARVEVNLTLAQDAIIVYSDNYTKDWQAQIDAHPTKVYAANGINKAVFVSKGLHTLSFAYQPPFYLFAYWLRWFLLGGTVLVVALKPLLAFLFAPHKFASIQKAFTRRRDTRPLF